MSIRIKYSIVCAILFCCQFLYHSSAQISKFHCKFLNPVIQSNSSIVGPNSEFGTKIWGIYDCRLDNGDSVTFTTIGTQISPDLPVAKNNHWMFYQTTSDPSIAIDPGEKNIIFSAGTAFIKHYNENWNAIDQELLVNNGETWSGGDLIPGPNGIPFFNPSVRIFSKNGSEIYYIGHILFFHHPVMDTGTMSQGISYSYDKGLSWSTELIACPQYFFNDNTPKYALERNHLAVDNSSGENSGSVYAAWTASARTPVNYNTYGVPYLGKICFSFSRTGIDWTANDFQIISDTIIPDTTGSVFNYGVNLQTGVNGEVFAVWSMYDWNTYSQTKEIMPPISGPEFGLGFTKSLDGGATFDPAHIISRIKGVHSDQNFISSHLFNPYSFPSMCVDQSEVHHGRIYIAWSNVGIPGNDSLGTCADIFVIHSDDLGATWSSPVKVNTMIGLADYKYSVYPWIACDNETGKICVIYYDDRIGVGAKRFNTYISMSDDGGESWDESHSNYFSGDINEYGGINDSSFCSTPNNFSHFTSYNGLAVKDGLAYPIWTSNNIAYIFSPIDSSQTVTVVSPYYIWNCLDHYSLTSVNSLEQGSVRKFECKNYIEANDFDIPDSTFCYFDAGVEITLREGFTGNYGCSFHGYIDGCEPFNEEDLYYHYYSGTCAGNGFHEPNFFKSRLCENLIKVYPNPCHGLFTIELGEFPESGSKLSISNILNETVMKICPVPNTSYKLDLTPLPKGLYFILLNTRDRSYFSKLLYR